MSQPIPHHDRTVQLPKGVSTKHTRIDSLVVQTSGLSLAGGQTSPVAPPGYNSVPTYNHLTSPTSSPKRIPRKPVGGGTTKVQAQTRAQVQAVPASGSMTSNVPSCTSSSPTRGVPANTSSSSSPTSGVPAKHTSSSSPTSGVPAKHSSSSPTSGVPACEPTSSVTDVPTDDSSTSSPSPPSNPNTGRSPVFSPLSKASTDSTLQTSVFSRITPCSTNTTIPPITSPPVQSAEKPPRLSKPIVIPQILNHKSGNSIGKPFTRAYAEILAQYSISQEEFLAFLDELNMDQVGHVAFDFISCAGWVIQVAGIFDPTGITGYVGKAITVSAGVGKLAYTKGPVSMKRWDLNRANEAVFKPRGLKVSVMSGKELRWFLQLAPTFPLCAQLRTDWVVPSAEQLLKGQRATLRVSARQLAQLMPRVHELVVAREANHELLRHSKLSVRRAAELVRDWQVGSEVQHELWRGKALSLFAAAESAESRKEKTKLLLKARAKDKEPIHTESISWLVIWNADGARPAAIKPNTK